MSLEFTPHSWTSIPPGTDIGIPVVGQITPLTPGKVLDTYGNLDVSRPFEALANAEYAASHPMGTAVEWNERHFVVVLPPITFEDIDVCDHTRILLSEQVESE